MRILFLANYYPPFELGGQERSCQQVVEGLQRRGHETLVLTSNHQQGNATDPGTGVMRRLFLEMDHKAWSNSVTFFTERKKRERENIICLVDTIQQFQPDVLFIWGLWNLPRSLPHAAEKIFPGRILYRFAEYWPTLPSQHRLYWNAPGRTRISRLVKNALRPMATSLMDRDEKENKLKFEKVICVSAATRDTLVAAGIPVEHAQIIYTGLDLPLFLNGTRTVSSPDEPVKLLYAGRITEEKGIHTAISALNIMVDKHHKREITLSIAGSLDRAYAQQLHRQVEELNLSDRVTFHGQLPAEKMPALYFAHDILVVPSIWPEPFARVVLEGMATGMAVVASTAGGTGEIIESDRNGLLFRPGDEKDLAHQLSRLLTNRHLLNTLGTVAKETVTTNFTVECMMDRMEQILWETAHARD